MRAGRARGQGQMAQSAPRPVRWRAGDRLAVRRSRRSRGIRVRHRERLDGGRARSTKRGTAAATVSCHRVLSGSSVGLATPEVATGYVVLGRRRSRSRLVTRRLERADRRTEDRHERAALARGGARSCPARAGLGAAESSRPIGRPVPGACLPVAETQHLGDRDGTQRRIADRGKRDEGDAVDETLRTDRRRPGAPAGSCRCPPDRSASAGAHRHAEARHRPATRRARAR